VTEPDRPAIEVVAEAVDSYLAGTLLRDDDDLAWVLEASERGVQVALTSPPDEQSAVPR
jgi:hypothetical protein